MTPQILFLAAALATGAPGRQQPAPAPQPSSNAPDRTITPALPAKVTVEGCVATEAEIPNRKTDLGDRTGLDKHFVLTNGAIVKGKSPGPAAAAAPAAGSGVAATGLAPMFQLHGLTDEQLKLHVGHRVRVEGRFLSPDASSSDDDLVKLDVATIRQVPGDCSVPKS